jgi:Tfp pilus assembly protein PilN
VLARELQQSRQEAERSKAEVERLRAEVKQLKEHNHALTEAATSYSLWGQKLERELARIDPAGAPARRFTTGSA